MNLIINVRENAGGSDSSFLPLLKYCLLDGKKITDIHLNDDLIEINCTERNVENRLQSFKDYRKMDLHQETIILLDSMEDNLQKYCGKGFIINESQDDIDLPFLGISSLKKVFILSDCMCGSSRDAFIQLMSQLPKVTVVGRNSMGILDYSDCTSISFDDYFLIYPTSRRIAIDNGNGMTGKGLTVDINIPWTTEHLIRDCDLDMILELINKSSIS